uniref:Protein sleepless n=1 Tax=Arion vulgaris TaxID=1028688 RepID=A0A0B7B4R0_9EUPU
MKTAQQVIACLFLLVLIIKEGLSLKCYSCNSFKDDDCETIRATTPEVTCSANQTMCRKVEQHMYYNKEDHVRVFRQCATSGTPGDCDTRTGTYRFKAWYCHCNDREHCNGSGNLIAPLMLTVAMIVASLGLMKL